MPSQRVLQEKFGEVEETTRLVKKYKVIGVANLQKVRAAQLQARRCLPRRNPQPDPVARGKGKRHPLSGMGNHRAER